MKRIILLCLFLSAPCWADDCPSKLCKDGVCIPVACVAHPEYSTRINPVPPMPELPQGGTTWPRLMPPAPTTTRWLGDAEPPPAPVPTHCRDTSTLHVDCVSRSYLMFGTIGKLALPDGTPVEFGLRSDGVMVWRKAR